MQLSCLWKNPAGDIKQRKCCMKDEEEDIEKAIPHYMLVCKMITIMLQNIN
jgi:hypothetical protein